MSLMKCPECNKEVSDSAETCPHCGYRLKDSKPSYIDLSVEKSIRDHFVKEMVAAVILAIIGLVVICVGFYFEVPICWASGTVILVGSIIGFVYNKSRYNKH